MNEMVFVDTGAFFSLLAHNDTFHKKSITLWALINESHLVTSEFVLIEAVTLIRVKIGIMESIAFINKIENDTDIKVIKIKHLVIMVGFILENLMIRPIVMLIVRAITL